MINVCVVTSTLGRSGGMESLKCLLLELKKNENISNVGFYPVNKLKINDIGHIFLDFFICNLKIVKKNQLKTYNVFIFSDILSWNYIYEIRKISQNAIFGNYVQHIELWNYIDKVGKKDINLPFKKLHSTFGLHQNDKKLIKAAINSIALNDFIIFNSFATQSNFDKFFGKTKIKNKFILYPPVFPLEIKKEKINIGLSWRGVDWKKDFKIISSIINIKKKFGGQVTFKFLGVPISKIHVIRKIGDYQVWCSNARFRKSLKCLDIFLYHSNLESFGIPPIEALIFSNATILTVNVPSIEELAKRSIQNKKSDRNKLFHRNIISVDYSSLEDALTSLIKSRIESDHLKSNILSEVRKRFLTFQNFLIERSNYAL